MNVGKLDIGESTWSLVVVIARYVDVFDRPIARKLTGKLILIYIIGNVSNKKGLVPAWTTISSHIIC